MTSKTKMIVKKHILVAWQDSDVSDQIKDRSFAGRLANAANNNFNNNNNNSNKENQPINGEDPNPDGKLLKKRRVSKRPSIAATAASTAAINELNLDQLTVSAEGSGGTKPLMATTVSANRLAAHFVFGNQAADGTTMSSKTSNNKLDQSHRISYHEMSTVLSAHRDGLVDKTIESLNQTYEEKYFPEWFRLMSFGFNVLVHGMGSKKSLLQKFAQTKLTEHFQIELLGYHYDFNARNIFKTIVSDVLELTEYYKTLDEQLTVINQKLDRPLYLIIHNIDGNCLRDSSIQFCLSELAANPFVHIIASIDHINSSLLWDQMQCSSFKWIHFEVNTLVPYNDEIMFENSLMLSQNTNVQLSSMIHILKSLTQNAKNIFLIMVQHVLNPENVKKSVTFNKLYHECREKFLVSNELTLRAQLTEFIDHKIIKLKAESDGYETIYLLIDEKNLKLYLEDIKDKV